MDNLGNLLARSLARVEPKRAARFAVESQWRRIVGPMLAAHSRPRVAGKVLIIEVDDERWRVQVEALDELLLQKVRAVTRDIFKIVVQLVPGMVVPEAPAELSVAGTEGADVVPAPKPPVEVTEELDERLSHIHDPDLREQTRAVAGHYLARQRRRKR